MLDKTRNNAWRINPTNLPKSSTNHPLNKLKITIGDTTVKITGKLKLNENPDGINNATKSTLDASIRYLLPNNSKQQDITVYLTSNNQCTTILGATRVVIKRLSGVEEFATK